MRSYSSAAERNREPILAVLKNWFLAPGTVLEIGAGTGQHAVYFAEQLPHLNWVATDRAENLLGVGQWLAASPAPNLRETLELDVCSEPWPLPSADYVFSANTAHIMSWREVQCMFAGVARLLPGGGAFVLYGPFNRQGEFTSESNRQFDASLRAQHPQMGLRDDQALIGLAERCGMRLAADYAMPANNRTLVWTKAGTIVVDIN